MSTALALASKEEDGEVSFLHWPEERGASGKARQQAARVAEKAASLITRHGWMQGKYGDREIGFCAMGALQMALADVVIFSSEFDALYYELRRAFWNLHKVGSIPTWNDSLPVSTGGYTVVQALNSVAAHLAVK